MSSFFICFEGLACIDGYDAMTWERLRLVIAARELYLTTESEQLSFRAQLRVPWHH